MRETETKNCIVCLTRKAAVHSGHVKKVNGQLLLAGFCKEHGNKSNNPSAWYKDKTAPYQSMIGWMGWWIKEMGEQ